MPCCVVVGDVFISSGEMGVYISLIRRVGGTVGGVLGFLVIVCVGWEKFGGVIICGARLRFSSD